MRLISQHIEEIQSLCLKHKVRSLAVFGSVLTNEFNTNSDVDFIVEFEEVDLNAYADNYFDFKFSLEDLFGRKVDLLEKQTINNPYLRSQLNNTKEVIYGMAG